MADETSPPSLTIGQQLARPPRIRRRACSWPIPWRSVTSVGHPVGRHSSLGLTAFSSTLLLVLSGFIGGNLVNRGVDTALGYADSELGPWHTRRPTVPITRTQTLLLKMLMSPGLAVVTGTIVMATTAGILGMDAAHLPLLWVFSCCATAAVGLGVQVINAVFGGIG